MLKPNLPYYNVEMFRYYDKEKEVFDLYETQPFCLRTECERYRTDALLFLRNIEKYMPFEFYDSFGLRQEDYIDIDDGTDVIEVKMILFGVDVKEEDNSIDIIDKDRLFSWNASDFGYDFYRSLGMWNNRQIEYTTYYDFFTEAKEM